MNTPTQLETLFFPVKHRPLQTSIDDELVKVPRYRVITCLAGVLGVKPAWRSEAQPQPTPLGRHLVFDHQQADALCRELYAQTFGVTATPIHWVGAAPAGEQVPIGAWAAVVYGHSGYTVADVLRAPQVRVELGGGPPLAAWEQALWEGTEPFAQELAGFEPALAFTNGFDYDDELLFYVLVTLPETTKPAQIWDWEEGSKIPQPRRPVLVLKSGRFRAEHIKKLHALKGKELLDGARMILPELAQLFRHELVEFANHYYHLRHTPVNPAALMPVILDLYNSNRNLSSIRLDRTLRNTVRQRVKIARRFFDSYNRDLASLVRFLMYADAFDPARFDRRAAEAALSQRDAYRNLYNRLSIRTVSDTRRLEDYLDSQMRAYHAVEEEL
jgi:hypothetical protein